MFDASKDVLSFHNEEVTLPRSKRTEMRDRRNANRDRLECRLKEAKKPGPETYISQGSYVMLTMVQDADEDYDIDDGIYFKEAELKHKDDSSFTPKEARQLVCDMLQDDRFKKQPKVLENCVRVYYDEGYHVDMPIYRIRESDGQYELAAGDEWSVSRAADVEEWFDTQNTTLSPDEDNGRQFRRVVRYLKKFARSRSTWKNEIATGFTITKLAAECYASSLYRDDVSLVRTMQAIQRRLELSLEVMHPVTPNCTLTTGPEDSKIEFLRDKLEIATEDLKVLDDSECTEEKAFSAWGKVFKTYFFSNRLLEETKAASGPMILGNLITKLEEPRQVDKRGDGRYA